MYVAEGKSCDPARVNISRYLGDVQTCIDGDERAFCALTEASLLNEANENDCKNKDYQNRKRVFSQRWRACQEVLQYSNTTDSTPLSSLCPPSVFSYLKCDSRTRQCSYRSGLADPDAIAACENKLTNCQDPEYLQDKAVWEKLNANCAEKWASKKQVDLWVPLGSGLLMLLLVVLIGVTAWRSQAWTSAQPGSPATQPMPPGPSGFCSVRGWALPIGGVALLLAGFWPGLVAVSQGWAPWGEAAEDSGYLIGGVVMSVLGAICLLASLWARSRDCPAAPALQTAASASAASVANLRIAKVY
jgi:hypothetical protein